MPVDLNLPVISGHEFREIQELAHSACGLDLPEAKRELVASRLLRKMRALGIRSFHEYYSFVIADGTGEALIEFIDALTTNHTSFLRGADHFDFVREQLVPLMRRGKYVRIWSAASSTGEEPYSIAMTLLDQDGLRPDLWSILASDISTRVLGIAKRAAYTQGRIFDVPAEWRTRFFEFGKEEWKDWVRVRPEVSSKVEFTRLNLLHDFSRMGNFEAIFCRNVMIYFNRETREDLVNRLAAQLHPGGYLFIGHSESLMGLNTPLEYIRPATYRKR